MTLSKVPAHLFIGSTQAITDAAQIFITQRVATCNNCNHCYTCKAIAQKQYHALLWLCPEKAYTKEFIEPLFKKLAFSRAAHDPFFIVLEKADYLSVACANSLLKSLEEPPAHFYFLLLSTTENVLPTLTSRCSVQVLSGEHSEDSTTLIKLLYAANKSNLTLFTKELERAKINEHAVPGIIEQVLSYWLTRCKQSPTPHCYKAITYLSSLLPLPIMPGSTKLYLRTVFLTLCGFGE